MSRRVSSSCEFIEDLSFISATPLLVHLAIGEKGQCNRPYHATASNPTNEPFYFLAKATVGDLKNLRYHISSEARRNGRIIGRLAPRHAAFVAGRGAPLDDASGNAEGIDDAVS
jgi:hypothetical protein